MTGPLKKARLLITASLIFAVSAALIFAGNAPEQPQNYKPQFYPFDKGEKATYNGSWLGIPLASAEIRMQPVVVNGKKFYQVKVQARTWRYLDLIWKMRDTIESTFDAETLHPNRFVFRQRENKKKNDTVAVVDPTTKKWTVDRKENNKPKNFEFTSSFAYDPISATYLARSVDFKVGDRLRLEVFGGKSRYLVTFDVAGKERISVKGGEIEAYKVIPQVRDLSKTGYAGRMRQATIWITADEKRTPIRIQSQVFIGSVTIEMEQG